MQINAQTTFTDIYNRMKPGLLESQDKHIRLNGNTLYTHNQLMAHGKGTAALNARLQKYESGADAVKKAVAHQYTPALADRVFRNLGLTDSQGRTREVTLGDLRAIRNEIRAELQRQTGTEVTKSDLSGLSGDPTTDAHVVFKGDNPELQHVSQTFRAFLDENYEQPTANLLDAYNALLANPTKAGADALIRDHINNRDVNIYENNKEAVREGVQGLGPDPTSDDIRHVFDHAIRDVNESFGGDLYSRFIKQYAST